MDKPSPDWATSICLKTYKNTIPPQNGALKRCSRVETPQHRVLENTLNMGSYFTWIKMIVFKEKHKGVQMRHEPDARSQNDHVVSVVWARAV